MPLKDAIRILLGFGGRVTKQRIEKGLYAYDRFGLEIVIELPSFQRKRDAQVFRVWDLCVCLGC